MKKQKREVHFGRKALSNVRNYFPGVTNVVDADKPLQIELTKRDSDMAKTRSHRGCALAVACTRVMHSDGAIIAIRTAYVIFKDRAVRYRLPESVSREIVSFDRNAGFAPGVYQLNAPSKYEQLGSVHTGRTHNPSERRPARFRHITSDVRTVMGYSETTGPLVRAEVPAYLPGKAAPKEKRAKRK